MLRKLMEFSINTDSYEQSVKVFIQDLLDVAKAKLSNNISQDNLDRITGHYDTWIQNIVELKNYSDDKVNDFRKGIYKIFYDAPLAEGKAFLQGLHDIFSQNEILLLTAIAFHDVGKYVQNPDHPAISFHYYQTLRAENFQSIENTEVYEYLQTMDEITRDILGLLIRHHDLGGISFDGNFGLVQKLKDDYQQIKDYPIADFQQLLLCVMAMDKASIANKDKDGFLSWYDIQRVKNLAEKILATGRIVDSLEDVADIVTGQFVMNYTHKQEAYDFYFPLFREIAYKYFEGYSKTFIERMQNSLLQVDTFNYVNTFLYHFAWDRDVLEIASVNMLKNEEKFLDKDILERYFMIKTALMFFYPTERDSIGRTEVYGNTPQDKRNIFAVQTIEEIYQAIIDYLETGKVTKILNL